MDVQSAQFVKSAVKPADFPKDRRPEIAFVGRSNVGKSTLLNAMLRKKGLAKTSSTPGKTQTINFFDVNGDLYFVDLPGYGYAKVPLNVKEEWGKFLTNYLRTREELCLAVMLLDARRKPSELDEDMLALLDEAEVPTLVVATKIDKLKRGQRRSSLETIAKTLDLSEDALILPFSAVTDEGRTPLWEIIEEVVNKE